MPSIRPYAYPTAFPTWLTDIVAILPLSIVGVVKRAQVDAKRVELFLRAASEGVMRRVVDIMATANPDMPTYDPIRAAALAQEVRGLVLASNRLAADYVEAGERMWTRARKNPFGTAWDLITRRYDPDAEIAPLRETARSIAMLYGFPYDVQKELGVQVPPPPPV
jgi:hypothetical protein